MSLLYSLNDFADFQRFFYDQVPFKTDFFEETNLIMVKWDFLSDFLKFFVYSLFRSEIRIEIGEWQMIVKEHVWISFAAIFRPTKFI